MHFGLKGLKGVEYFRLPCRCSAPPRGGKPVVSYPNEGSKARHRKLQPVPPERPKRPGGSPAVRMSARIFCIEPQVGLDIPAEGFDTRTPH